MLGSVPTINIVKFPRHLGSCCLYNCCSPRSSFASAVLSPLKLLCEAAHAAGLLTRRLVIWMSLVKPCSASKSNGTAFVRKPHVASWQVSFPLQNGVLSKHRHAFLNYTDTARAGLTSREGPKTQTWLLFRTVETPGLMASRIKYGVSLSMDKIRSEAMRSEQRNCFQHVVHRIPANMMTNLKALPHAKAAICPDPDPPDPR